MFPKFRLLGLFLLFSLASFAQRPMSVAEVVSFIKSQIKSSGDDRTTADYLRKIKLTQHLEDRTVEELQGQGAGPLTVSALKKLAADSASLPAPPPLAAAPPPPPLPPPPSAAEQQQILADMREYALGYTKNLPNYVCVQTTHRRQQSNSRRPGYGGVYADVIQEMLTFYDKKETYKVVMHDGKSVSNMTHEQLGGVRSSGEFGTMLANIFDPDSGADMSWERWATLRGRRMYVFSYHIGKDHGYSMLDEDSHREYTSAYKGEVYFDRDLKAIMVVTLDTVNIPPDFPIKDVHIRLDYDLTKVGDQAYILPYHYQLDSKADRGDASNEADYKLYQKYGAESSITFGDTAPVDPNSLKDEPDKK